MGFASANPGFVRFYNFPCSIVFFLEINVSHPRNYLVMKTPKEKFNFNALHDSSLLTIS